MLKYLIPLSAFLLTSCNDPFECDGKNTGFEVVTTASTLSLDVKMRVSPKTSVAYPQVVAKNIADKQVFKQRVETKKTETQSLATAQVQLLDKDDKVLFSKSVISSSEVFFKLAGNVLSTNNADYIEYIKPWVESQAYEVNLPNLEKANRVKIVEKIDQQYLTATANGSSTVDNVISSMGYNSNGERSFSFDLDKLPNKNEGFPISADSEVKRSKVTKLHYSGNPENRLNIAILADGYTREEITKFEADAGNLKTALFSQVPFKDYQNYVNLWMVSTVSKESGVSCDDEEKKGKTRKNAYGSVFPMACLNAAFGTNFSDRAIMQTGYSHINDAKKLIKENGKQVDNVEVYILANSKKNGGAAIIWASQTNASSSYTMSHEIGHTVGNLADEYSYDTDFCLFFNFSKPNISFKQDDRKSVKWSHWIENGTPIPTKDQPPNFSKIGLFKGASSCKFFYRPARECKMHSSAGNFCSVCLEQMILQIYERARPIDGELKVTELAKGQYQIDGAVLKNNLGTRWLVDENVQYAEPTYQGLKVTLAPGSHRVRLQVQDFTDKVRADRCRLAEEREVAIDVR